jgi:hypothetical protein
MYRRISLAQAVVAITIAGTAPAHAADASKLDVRVRDISGSALITSIANMAGIAFVAGGELSTQRVSIDERSVDPQAWIERFAVERKLATKTRNGILLIASECRLARAAASRDLNIDPADTVSLFYQNSRVSTVVAEAFAMLLEGERVEYPEEDANASISVRLKDVSTSDAINAVASVTGWEVRHDEGGLAFTHAGPACDLAVAEGPPRLPPPEYRSCPGLMPQHRCEPLERYGIERLRVVGQISRTGGSKFALVEVPGGVVWRIGKGNYMGLDYGLITLIDDEGVTINEIVHDDDTNRWVERTRLLPFIR